MADGKTDSYVYVIFRPNGVPCYVGHQELRYDGA